MQIITNLASNACKFTPPGGLLRIATRLILPACSHRNLLAENGLREGESTEKADKTGEELGDVPRLSAHSLDRHNRWHTPQRDWIVVRIEVTDTGYGIPRKEMVQSNLFCTLPLFASIRYPDTFYTNSCIQSDRARQAAGWKGNRSRPCSCQTDRQAQRRAVRCQFASWQGIHILG